MRALHTGSLCALMGAGLVALAVAQEKPAAAKPEAGAPAQTAKDKIDKRLFELRGIEDTLRVSEEQRRKIETELEAVRHDRARLNAALIETTTAIQKAETRTGELEARLREQLRQEAALQSSLESRRAIMADILAALQRMGRRPPPALLVAPDDILKAIRTSMMLGGVLPELREEARVLAADLEELAAVRKRVAEEQASLSAQVKTLGAERIRLAGLTDARQKTLDNVRGALASERGRAAELAKQAATLKDLIGRMESEVAGAKRAAEAARAAEKKRLETAALRPGLALEKPSTALANRARLTPAIAFGEAKGLLPLPVSGKIAKSFGDKDAFGGDEKGLSIVTQPGAIVASPGDGWVAYAGPYRAYGQLLIVNAGSGYYIVLAGMERINVEVGQFVLYGEPVASMGDGSARSAAAMAIGAGQPVLYVEFRKDGAAIDPGPWWTRAELQKVRG